MIKRHPSAFLLGAACALSLGACSQPFDLDMRSTVNGFDTSAAAASGGARPVPDANGVMSYPTYKVVLARQGETPMDVAARLGIDGASLASLNGLSPVAPLNQGELLTLPDGAVIGGPSALPDGTAPLQHKVQTGETAYSIARLYDVPVQSLARLNNLDEQLRVRTGQVLLVPVVGATVQPQSAPGQGSMTPIPPSSTTALPSSAPQPLASAPGGAAAQSATPQVAPRLDSTASPASSNARMVLPMSGPIVRAYSKGRNDGIDIGGAPGSTVKAADAGTVAAVTQNTDGAKIVVVKHSGGLLSVYLNMGDLNVSQGGSVQRGQTIGKLSSQHDALHFEVRKGMESVDPGDYLP